MMIMTISDRNFMRPHDNDNNNNYNDKEEEEGGDGDNDDNDNDNDKSKDKDNFFWLSHYAMHCSVGHSLSARRALRTK